MVLGYDKLKKLTINASIKYVLITSLFLIIIPIYLISSKEINTTFGDLLKIGYGASDQEEMKNKLLSQIKEPLETNPALFYLDASQDTKEPALFYPVTVISGFEEKMHFRNWEIVNGCIGLITDPAILKNSITIQDGIKGFSVPSLCVYNYSSAGRPEVFYKPENLHALKLEGKEMIDIKESVLNELGF